MLFGCSSTDKQILFGLMCRKRYNVLWSLTLQGAEFCRLKRERSNCSRATKLMTQERL